MYTFCLKHDVQRAVASHKGYRASVCLPCRSEKRKRLNSRPEAKLKRQRLRDPIAYREYQLKRNFGITQGEYNDMLAEQEHACKLCRTPSLNFKKALAVDHCHTTGRIRGLLCAPCNKALGLLKDDASLVSKALDYLRSYNGDS